MSAKRKSKKIKEEETMENVNEIINNTEEIVTPETVEEVLETTVKTAVEPNENKEGTIEVTENVEEVLETPEIEIIEATPIIGRICGFSKLYVRSEANRESEPVGTVDDKEDLIIDLENSTEDFYKVRTAAGIDGYCVKSNVKID